MTREQREPRFTDPARWFVPKGISLPTYVRVGHQWAFDTDYCIECCAPRFAVEEGIIPHGCAAASFKPCPCCKQIGGLHANTCANQNPLADHGRSR